MEKEPPALGPGCWMEANTRRRAGSGCAVDARTLSGNVGDSASVGVGRTYVPGKNGLRRSDGEGEEVNDTHDGASRL